MAEWQSVELADSDTLEALGKYGTQAVEKINIALDLVKGGAEIGKLFLMTAVNPLAIAIVIAADEMIALLGQYKESGISILIIDPTDPQNGRKQENKLGLEMLRDSVGPMFEISYPHPQPSPSSISGSYTVNDEYRKSLSLGDLTNWRDKNGKEKGHAGFIPPTPKLVFPYNFVQGGYNPETWTGDAISVAQSSGVNAAGVEIPGVPFPELPADETIEMMAAAFEDEGDIPKYRIDSPNKKPKQKYYDVDGAQVTFLSSQDKLKDQRLELFSSANTKIATSERGLLTTRIATGRPEYHGDVSAAGVEVSAVAIIVAAQNPLKFIESLSSLIETLLPDHTELMKSISAFTASLTFTEQNLTLRVDTDYGDFQKGDLIIGEKSGCIGEITGVTSSEDSVMTSVVVETNQLDVRPGPIMPAQPPISIVEKTIDRNPNGQFNDVVITWEPRGKSHPFGKFNPRENVFEAQANVTDVGGKPATTYSKKIPPEGWHRTLAAGEKGQGILPKWSTVKAQSPLAEASTAPNFSSAKLAQMIPGYGAFFDELINLAEKLKSFAEGALESIQKLIDVIDKAIEFFEELAESIITLIELLTQGIPNTGIWFMGMTTTTGNEGLAAGLRGGDNAPDSSYVFSGGLLLVGPIMKTGPDMNKKLWEMLGIEFQSV